MYLILAILAFNIIVIVHELGHFIIAKKMGIRVLEFSLFIGPKLFGITRGETTYSLRLIPLIAYVKMEGEEEASDSERAFNNKPKYARALTTIAGPLANLLLAAILLTGYFAVRGYESMEIKTIVAQSPAAKAGMKPGDKIVSYGGKRTYTPTDVLQFLYVSKGEPAKVEYKRDGKLLSGVLEPIKHPETSVPKIGVVPDVGNPKGSNIIREISPDLPAAAAGLQAGDRIIAINGIEVDSSERLVELIIANGIKELEVTAERDGAEINTKVMPVEVKSEEWYETGLEFREIKGNILQSFGQSAAFTYSIIRSVFYSPEWLITGKANVSDMIGPIGMVSAITTTVRQAPDAAQMLLYLMYIMGLFSVAIGATNLIPFPMLDGGRLLLIGIEAVRGKPLSPEKESYISIAGFAFIILLGIYIAYNDILKLVTGQR
jgi:regulator of sigma E protease